MVEAVGRKIVAVSGLENLKWEFFVIDSPETNAFVLPGACGWVSLRLNALLISASFKEAKCLYLQEFYQWLRMSTVLPPF